MRDIRNIEGGVRDENIMAGSECAHFKRWDAGIVLKLLAGCGI